MGSANWKVVPRKGEMGFESLLIGEIHSHAQLEKVWVMVQVGSIPTHPDGSTAGFNPTRD